MEDEIMSEVFLKQVDVVVVYINVSIVFIDGGQFGLGVEIGISIQKFYVCGLMVLCELMSYKWVVWGDGQVWS